MFRPKIELRTAKQYRGWLLKHRVTGFSFGNGEYGIVEGFQDGMLSAKTVSLSAIRLVDSDLVWLHQPDGSKLPPKTLFALREQVAAARSRSGVFVHPSAKDLGSAQRSVVARQEA